MCVFHADKSTTTRIDRQEKFVNFVNGGMYNRRALPQPWYW